MHPSNNNRQRPGVSRGFILMISVSMAIAIFAWAAAFVAIFSE